MKWQFKDGTKYEGPTHLLAGKTYSGATRTPASRQLVLFEPKPRATPKSQLIAPSKPRKIRKKPAPKPRGTTAWD